MLMKANFHENTNHESERNPDMLSTLRAYTLVVVFLDFSFFSYFRQTQYDWRDSNSLRRVQWRKPY